MKNNFYDRDEDSVLLKFHQQDSESLQQARIVFSS